jgi:hypothetical protein
MKIIFSILLLVSSLNTYAASKAEQAAKELANPNTALASLNFKVQFRNFAGDLPGADNEDSTTLLFQPSMPFPREDGSKILFRPAIPFITSSVGDKGSGFGDIAFDLAYAPKPSDSNPGFLLAYGFIASLPTGSSKLGFGETTGIGPEILLGKITKTSVLGIFPNHQWDVSGNKKVSLTSTQIFFSLLPGGGWNYGSNPIINWDHVADQWTIPLNANVGKTVILADRPWKLSFEANYFIEKANSIGPELMIGFNITPVVENSIANWFK